MAKLALKKNSTDVTVYLFVQDSSKTAGEGLTGLAYNTASLVASYVRPLAARQAISLASQTVTGAHSDGGFVEVDSTNMPGLYRLDLPDAVCATGVPSAVVMLKGAANMAPVLLEIQLTDFDLNSTSNPVGAAASVTAGVAVSSIANNAITANSIASSAITDAKIATDAISGEKLATDAVSKIQNGLATPTNITGGTITTVTNLTNLPSIPADWITANGIKADAVDEIADGVWDEAIAGHVAAGTFGAKNQKAVPSETLNDYKADVSSLATSLQVTGVENKIDTVDSVVDDIKAKTDNLPADPASQSAVESAIDEIPAGISADDILNSIIEGAVTLRDSLKLANAMNAGKVSGGKTTSIVFRDLADTLDRIIMTVDENGNRSAVVKDLG